MNEKAERLKSATEIALRLGISKPTLCRMMQRGEINFYRIGARVIFSEERHFAPFLASVERGAMGKDGERYAS